MKTRKEKIDRLPRAIRDRRRRIIGLLDGWICGWAGLGPMCEGVMGDVSKDRTSLGRIRVNPTPSNPIKPILDAGCGMLDDMWRVTGDTWRAGAVPAALPPGTPQRSVPTTASLPTAADQTQSDPIKPKSVADQQVRPTEQGDQAESDPIKPKNRTGGTPVPLPVPRTRRHSTFNTERPQRVGRPRCPAHTISPTLVIARLCSSFQTFHLK